MSLGAYLALLERNPYPAGIRGPMIPIRAILLADATLSLSIGSRIYPMQRPQGSALPAITYSIISGSRGHAYGGMTSAARVRMQLTAWAAGGSPSAYATVQDIIDAAIAALGGYAGTSTGVSIDGVFIRDRRDLREDGPDGVIRAVGATFDIDVHYQEA